MKRIFIILMSIMLVVMVSGQTIYNENVGRGFSLASNNDTRLAPRLLNYQGYLTDTQGNPVSDSLDMVVRIYGTASGGTPLWTETQIEVPVNKGIFNLILGSLTPLPDSVFTKSASRWLELRVASQTLSPRTQITSAGYAFTSTYSDTAEYARSAPLTSDNDWTYRITDGADTTLQTGGRWGLARAGNTLYGNADSTHVNLGIGSVTGSNGQNYKYCVVGGGSSNNATAPSATIGGGWCNTASGLNSTVAGGDSSVASNDNAIVAGGHKNTASGAGAFIGGGSNNNASGWRATVAGGSNNTANGSNSFLGGGVGNTIDGIYGCIPGGQDNHVDGRYSLAAGYRASALHNWTFVWSDSSSGSFSSSGDGQFLIRALGGVGINTASPADELDVNGTARMTGFVMSTGASNGYVLTSDGSGTGTWQAAAGGGDNDWNLLISDGADTTLQMGGQWGLARGGNTLYGNADSTHVNLGAACTTGTSGQNFQYCAVTGGYRNKAINNFATVGGGFLNMANGPAAVVGGGYNNKAESVTTFIGGGYGNTASGWDAVVGGGRYDTTKAVCGAVLGGYSNLAGDATVDTGAVVAGGYDNAATGRYSFNGGGNLNDAGGDYAVVAGGQFNIAGGVRSTIGGGGANLADGNNATVGGGELNCISGGSSYVGGGYGNTINGDYSSIVGGYNNWITTTGDYSYLFGIVSTLTQDSTFMVDMPHIRFGKETGGYEFPISDGTNGQVIVTNGSGQLSWGTLTTSDNDWTRSGGKLYTYNTTDTVGIGTASPRYPLDVNGIICGGTLDTVKAVFGGVVSGYSNLAGDAATDTGAVVAGGYNNGATGRYSFSGGGQNCTAGGDYAVVTGGYSNSVNGKYAFGGSGQSCVINGDDAVVVGGNSNNTNGYCATVGGGFGNNAMSNYSTVAGGNNNVCSGINSAIGGGLLNATTTDRSTIGGGYMNTAGYCAVVDGGYGNAASGEYASVGGGNADSAKAIFGGVVSGYSNLAGDAATDTGAVVAGGYNNGATGRYSFSGGGQNCTAGGDYAVVDGGNSNNTNGYCATVGGGFGNNVNGNYATVDGGNNNTCGGAYSTIGGGVLNLIGNSYSTIAGGNMNTAGTEGAAVVGGSSNFAGYYAAVGGGNSNTASGSYSAIAGGAGNKATGSHSAVPGGNLDSAGGSYSLAAGRRAKANHSGAFVWADGTDADFASTNANQFLVRASGGVGINTASPTEELDVNGTVKMTGFAMPTGASSGYVLTSDGSGTGTWQAATGGGDNDWVISGSNIYSDVSGNVGIGTSSPGVKLDVDGDGRFTGNVDIAGGLDVYGDITSQNQITGYGFGCVGNMDVTNDGHIAGRLGLGTGSPTAKLEITGMGSGLALKIVGAGSACHFYNDASGTHFKSYDSTNTRAFYFHTGSDWTPELYLSASGDLGVGTSTPAARLDVSGTGRFNGNVNISSGGLNVEGDITSQDHMTCFGFACTGTADVANDAHVMGRLGVNTTTPASEVDISGSTGYGQFRMRTTYTPSGTSDPNGNVGDVAWDADYVYIKTAAGWKRSALSTW